MSWSRLRSCTVIGCSLLLAGVSCVTREEKIKIAADRTVTIELEYAGEPKELDGGDAMPSNKTGWTVTRKLEKQDDQTKLIIRACQTFAPGADLPRSYAAEDDPDADLYLDFPTRLWTEQREDGLYYHFHRIYTPRRWAYVHYWEERMQEMLKEDLPDKDKPVEEFTHEERVGIAEAVAAVEALKRIEFAREAIQKAEPDLQQDHRCKARQAIVTTYEDTDWEELLEQYMELPKESRDEYFERTSRGLWERAREAMLRSLRTDGGLTEPRIAEFERAFDRAERYYDMTSRLGGHHFQIRVMMPGDVVAHNADDENSDGTIEWEFNGKAFRDRPFELMVTSRVQPVCSND